MQAMMVKQKNPLASGLRLAGFAVQAQVSGFGKPEAASDRDRPARNQTSGARAPPLALSIPPDGDARGETHLEKAVFFGYLLGMQHENFHYRGELIELGHLAQISADFKWTDKDGSEQTYRVWLRYSNHCYSRELDEGESQAEDAYVVETTPRLRVYCPERYQQTTRLVSMMADLFNKPTSRVALTHEANWTIFQLYLPPEGGAQHRYCVFFRLRNSALQPADQAIHALDMHVESAYIRANMVQTVRSCPFGQVAHMTRNSIPYR